MRIRALVAFWLALLGATCWGVDVGTFDVSRLYTPNCSFVSGDLYTDAKADWEHWGVTWHETGMLTPDFLATVQVFVTSMVNTTWMTSDEQSALVGWVKAGGTLVAIGDCS